MKGSLKYVEVKLGHVNEEKEKALTLADAKQQDLDESRRKLKEAHAEIDKLQRETKRLKTRVADLEETAEEMQDKGRDVSTQFQRDINSRDEELGRLRGDALDRGDEIKLLTVSREKMRQQNEALRDQLKRRDAELVRMKADAQKSARVVDSLCLASKTGSFGVNIDQVKDEAER